MRSQSGPGIPAVGIQGPLSRTLDDSGLLAREDS